MEREKPMPTKAEIELAKAVLVLVRGTIRDVGINAYQGVDLGLIEALANHEGEEADAD